MPSPPRPHRYLVVDLEATCCDDSSIPREEMEIIEIGAVLVDGESLEAVDEFQTLVRPVRHPALTPFCVELTSITQDDVDGAPPFPEALRRMREWHGERPALFSSWGRFDRTQLHRDCTHHAVDDPLAGEHLDLKRRFSEVHGKRTRYGMARALRMCGLPLLGTHHRGIDDARNIARLLPFIVGGRALPGGKRA